ncbi:VOC family protein [Nocardioides euryhalodurans]|uniref:VOC family protein n=1 Tax=Nocardioides euryhalodurans TaxID=2518370 RepID=A0A4P7GJH9_9ACTN|nr:VOC family protein [Nocardioides euryhalodurans]QBR91919.1 VOC family protein [Nocardioides euryhalodurans]
MRSVELFAGIPVTDYERSLPWYERLLGSPPDFLATETEAVWQVAGQGWVYVVQRPERAGQALLTMLVPDLDRRVAEIAGRGIEPAVSETYDNGTRKVTYRDPDGNEVGFGGVPGG